MSRRAFARLAAATVPVVGAAPVAAGRVEPAPADRLESEFLMRVSFEYRIVVPGSRQSHRDAPRTVVEIGGGAFEGPKLKGTVTPASGVWPHRYAERPYESEVRLTLLTDDGQLIFMQYRGLIDGEDKSALRIAPSFGTSHGKYAWLNDRITVGVGHVPPGTTGVAGYRIYQIV